MASAGFDLTTALLGVPKPLAYGTVRGSGNLVFQQQLTDHTRVAFYLLGEGPWDSILRLWVNAKQIALPDTTKVHFHPGTDGEIGAGMAEVSTGGDQKVDAFWSGLSASLSRVTWSRYAYLALTIPPDPAAPSPELKVLADYKATQCRIFDGAGNQTAFQWTDNPAWWICDFLIRKFILRSGKVNQPLLQEERDRFDWAAWVDAAAYYDEDIGGGIRRFSDGGVIFLDAGLTADRALEQLLLMCRSYILERGGKLALYADKPRSSVFTFRLDDVEAGSFKVNKNNLRAARNRITATWRELGLAAGSSDDATRFSTASKTFDHVGHQLAIGARGPGLSPIQKPQEMKLDFGVNTAERVARICTFLLRRQLGDDVDTGVGYVAPVQAEWTGFENSLAVEPGDIVTLDAGVSEEWGGQAFEVLEVDERPDGRRHYRCLSYEPDAFVDVAQAPQATEAPDPGQGEMPVSGGAQYNHRPLSDPLTATDAGATATINVAAYTHRVAGVGDLSISSGSITGLNFATLYFVYFDDLGNPPTGGAKTFVASTVKEDAFNGRGRFFVGSIITPRDGAPDTIGNNDGGSDAQSGLLSVLYMSTQTAQETSGTGQVLNGRNAVDGDPTSSATVQATANGSFPNYATLAVIAPPGIVRRFVTAKLKIRWDCTQNNPDSGTYSSTVSVGYGTQGIESFDTGPNVVVASLAPPNTQSVIISEVTLPAGINLSRVYVFLTASLNNQSPTSGAVVAHLYEAWIEAKE